MISKFRGAVTAATSTMDRSRLRTGERIAAGAALLLFFDLFLKWYSVDVGGALGPFADSLDIDTSVSAWTAFGFTDILLFLVIAATIALVALHGYGRTLRLPVSRSVIIAALGAIATLWVMWRLVNEPGANQLVDLKIGAYLGLMFAAGIAFGGWKAMQDEGVSLQDAKAQVLAAVNGGGEPVPVAEPSAEADTLTLQVR